MKILIVGGGVAGPALAGFLKNTEHEIVMIDQAPQWGDIGYAITLWGNGRKMLEKLGADHLVEKEGYEMPWSAFEDEDGNFLTDLQFSVFRPYGLTIVVTRTVLHRALIESMGDNVEVRFGTTVNKIEQDENRVIATFSDGKTEEFDLLVGSDGIHSKVRQLVFGSGFLKSYGWRVWAFWTPPGMGSPRGAVEIADSGRVFFSYPMEDRSVVMFGAAVSPDVPGTPHERKKRLKDLFKGFKKSVVDMIDEAPDPEKIFEDDLSYVEMKDWYKGRVVLAGDSQHAISPITGMGSSMALEDAYVLAEELKNNSDLQKALQSYASRREKRIRDFHKISSVIERWTMVKSPLAMIFRDILIRLIPTSYFSNKVKKVLEDTP